MSNILQIKHELNVTPIKIQLFSLFLEFRKVIKEIKSRIVNSFLKIMVEELTFLDMKAHINLYSINQQGVDSRIYKENSTTRQVRN